MQLGHPHDDDELVESHEINVTPFIDVMLVLLIIFMVAAPLATVDIPVDLPASNASKQQRPDTPILFTIREDLSLVLGDTPSLQRISCSSSVMNRCHRTLSANS